MDPNQAAATQIANIEKKTGKSLAELRELITQRGPAKHGQIRAWLVDELGLGHGDANTLTHIALGSDGASAAAGKTPTEVLDEIYSGKKAHQRPIHETLMAAIDDFGDFEVAPKKGYVSLRRKKQFAMLGPKTNDRFELGLNLREEVDHPRIKAMPPGGMCHYVAGLTSSDEVDDELIAVVRRAYDAAG